MSKSGRGSGEEGYLGIQAEVSARGTGEKFAEGDVLDSFMRIELDIKGWNGTGCEGHIMAAGSGSPLGSSSG